MPISTSRTLRDADHVVTYLSPSGATITAPRDVVLTAYAPNQPGTYPVIVYSHGHSGSSSANGGAGQTAQALADLGYIVILPNHLDSLGTYPSWLTSQFSTSNPASGLHRAADMQFALDMASTLVAGLPGYTADLTSPVVAGHSHGAFTAGLLIGLDSDRPGYETPTAGNPYGLTSVSDPRFKAGILLSPQGEESSWADLTGASWDDITVPLLTITGTEDSEPGGLVDWPSRLDAFHNADGASSYGLVYRDAGHNDIGGNTDIPGITASIAGFVDQFLDGHLRGDAAALAGFADASTLLASDALLTQAYVRLVANTPGIGALTGTTAGDELSGLSSHDRLFGGTGDDVLDGGRGHDTINGGAGHDILRVQGARADYRLLTDGDDFVLKGPDGRDQLTGVELVRFSSGETLDLARLYGFDSPGPEVLPALDVSDVTVGKDEWSPVSPGTVDSPAGWSLDPILTPDQGFGIRGRMLTLLTDQGVLGLDLADGGWHPSITPCPWV